MMNQESLLRMARRYLKSIRSSTYRSPLLALFSEHLTQILQELRSEPHPADDLKILEQDLEAIGAALVHLHISFPYNEILYVPRILPEEHIRRIQESLQNAKRRKRHLRIAHSQ